MERCFVCDNWLFGKSSFCLLRKINMQISSNYQNFLLYWKENTSNFGIPFLSFFSMEYGGRKTGNLAKIILAQWDWANCGNAFALFNGQLFLEKGLLNERLFPILQPQQS